MHQIVTYYSSWQTSCCRTTALLSARWSAGVSWHGGGSVTEAGQVSDQEIHHYEDLSQLTLWCKKEVGLQMFFLAVKLSWAEQQQLLGGFTEIKKWLSFHQKIIISELSFNSNCDGLWKFKMSQLKVILKIEIPFWKVKMFPLTRWKSVLMLPQHYNTLWAYSILLPL